MKSIGTDYVKEAYSKQDLGTPDSDSYNIYIIFYCVASPRPIKVSVSPRVAPCAHRQV